MTETVKLITPIDGTVYAERPVATDKAIDAAVESAKQAQADWAQTSIAERGRLIVGVDQDTNLFSRRSMHCSP